MNKIDARLKARAYLVKVMEGHKMHDVALTIKVRGDQFSLWLKGKHSMRTRHARRLARYFDVSPELFLEDWYQIPSDDHRLCTELKRWRLRMGLSTHELSVLLGYSQSYIVNLEAGKRELKQEKIDEIRMLFESVESHLPKNF